MRGEFLHTLHRLLDFHRQHSQESPEFKARVMRRYRRRKADADYGRRRRLEERQS